nr:TPA_asm: TK [Bos-associated insect adintovirus 2]
MKGAVVFLDGVACCGKTTTLRSLAKHYLLFKVTYSDYAEDLKANLIQQKITDKFTSQLYMIFAMERFFKLLHAETLRCLVFDRMPITTMFYGLVFDLLDGSINSINVIDEKVKDICITSKSFFDHKSFILLSGNPTLTLEMMKIRNNKIDNLSLEYVHAQNVVFGMVCLNTAIPAITITQKEDLNKTFYIIWNTVVLKKKYEEYVCKPNKLQKFVETEFECMQKAVTNKNN